MSSQDRETRNFCGALEVCSVLDQTVENSELQIRVQHLATADSESVCKSDTELWKMILTSSPSAARLECASESKEALTFS